MSYKEDKYFNNYLDKLPNDNINMIYKDNYKIKEEKYEEYSKFDSFSSLFSRNTTPAAVTADTVPRRQSNLYPQLNPRVVDPRTMWSPRDTDSGKVYEWNRGVIGISVNGQLIKKNLDIIDSNHGPQTQVIGTLTGCPTSDSAPFAAGVSVSNQGTIIIQTEGANCFVYYPPMINEVQFNILKEQLLPRINFEFSFVRETEIYEDQNLDSTLSFGESLIEVDLSEAMMASR